MKLHRFLTLSATPCVAWALTTGCGSGGGFAGGWGAGSTSGSSGAAVAGATAGSGAGTGGSAQGAEGGAADIDSGVAGNLGGEAGNLGGQAGAAAGAGFGGVGGASAGRAGGGTAGSAGAGGNGAESGAGGSAGAAGSGGASGTSGSSGAAATAGSGGASATGGMGAMSGLGGSSVGGSAGMGGSAGTGGTGGPLRTCAERCNTNADCRIFSVDADYHCNAGTDRCERFAEPCRSSDECVPDASLWLFACRSDADCFFFTDDLCVDVGGVGRCARRAPSANGCADPNPDEVTLPRFGSGGSALVCANTSRTCSEGECVPGCASNADCSPAQNGSVCDLGTRLCRCVRDQDCGGPGVSRCNTASGRCECASADDCDDVSNANVCAAGRCGCSNVSACSDARTFAGTSYVCE